MSTTTAPAPLPRCTTEYLAAVTTALLDQRVQGMSALLSEDATSIQVDVDDPTGANGQRTFTIQVREVDAPGVGLDGTWDSVRGIVTDQAVGA